MFIVHLFNIKIYDFSLILLILIIGKRKPAKAGLLLTTYHIVRRQQAINTFLPNCHGIFARHVPMTSDDYLAKHIVYLTLVHL